MIFLADQDVYAATVAFLRNLEPKGAIWKCAR